MKYVLFLAILPCCLCFADNQIGSIQCPDGTECAFGKTCCESKNRQAYECCDLPEEELMSKKLVLGDRPSSSQSLSLAASPSNSSSTSCIGTDCGFYRCCEYMYNAECCSDDTHCCPSGFRCCPNGMLCCVNGATCCSDGMHCCAYGATCCSDGIHCCDDGASCCLQGSSAWCCKRGYRCGSSYRSCKSGAASAKVALVPLFIALVMAVASKYFL